jgi:hypothetical protein
LGRGTVLSTTCGGWVTNAVNAANAGNAPPILATI